MYANETLLFRKCFSPLEQKEKWESFTSFCFSFTPNCETGAEIVILAWSVEILVLNFVPLPLPSRMTKLFSFSNSPMKKSRAKWKRVVLPRFFSCLWAYFLGLPFLSLFVLECSLFWPQTEVFIWKTLPGHLIFLLEKNVFWDVEKIDLSYDGDVLLSTKMIVSSVNWNVIKRNRIWTLIKNLQF